MEDKLSMHFSDSEWLRYTRHLQLPQLGISGQKRLKASRVLIVGAGGLGSPVSLYLAAAGVGHITIVDGDTVDLTNLQRQILFTTDDIGKSKAACAQKRLLSLNPEINVISVKEHLSVDNVTTLIESTDLVLDCTDNFATRYLINDTCVHLRKSWLFASIYQFSGQCSLFTPDSACFRCLFPEAPTDIADCNTAGVVGVLPGLLGTMQASEAVKFLAGLPVALENMLCMIETMDLSINKIQLAKNTNCPVCSDNKSAIADKDYSMACSVNVSAANEIDSAEFAQCLLSKEDAHQYFIVDVRSMEEREGFHLGGTHIPLNEINNNIDKLPKEKVVLCYCQTGIRSQKATEILHSSGFQAKSLRGGIVDFPISSVVKRI